MSITRTIARNILALAASEPPAEAIAKARLAVFDTLGVTLAGSTHEGAAKLRSVILPSAAPGTSLAIGTTRRIDPADAAQINGMAGHMLDFDDSNSQFRGHPSVAILPATLALAETHTTSGMDLLRAYIVGFETGARVGMGVGPYEYNKGWHPTTSIGIFGAIGACAVQEKLDEDQITMALGIAAAMCSGIKSNFGSMTKPFGVSQAARNAVIAIKLAQAGFTSKEDAFEHPHGYLNVYCDGPEHYDVSKIVEGWGKPLCILDLGIKQKRFPCCYACLPPIDAMQQVMERDGLKPEQVEAIDIAVHPIRFPHINVPDPKSPLDAKFSVAYCLSRVLLTGRLAMSDFEGDTWCDPTTRALMQRVAFHSYKGENLGGAELAVTTTDGRTLHGHVESAFGASYAHSLPEHLLEEKFSECAGRALPAAAVEELTAGLRNLNQVTDIRTLTAIMEKLKS